MIGQRVRQARVHLVEPAGEATAVAVEGPAADPGEAGPPVPGDDPIVQGEAKRWQSLVIDGDGRQALQRVPEVVAEEAHEAAEEAGRIRRDHDRPIEATEEAPGDGERIRPGGGRVEHGDGIGGEVGPSGVPAGPCAFEERQAGQVAESLGDVDGARGGEAIRQAPEAQWRIASRARDHRRMIRPVGPPGRRVASPDGPLRTCAADDQIGPMTIVRPATDPDLLDPVRLLPNPSFL